MKFIVKICGLSEPETLASALDADADMVGFVFFPKSPRHVTLTQAAELGRRVEGRAAKVALTVNADDATLAAIIDTLGPDVLQLHGRESAERVHAVRARFGLPVMRALTLSPNPDRHAAEVVACPAADLLLFDAPPPAATGLPGGNGATFDWTMLGRLTVTRPWLLAGGLHEGNVERAVRAAGASGVDVSSGVERAPGVKDADRIARFVAAARAAHRRLDHPGR